MAEQLPPRTTRRYERVPDFLEPEFQANSVEAHLQARDQRIREHVVALEDLKSLQRQLGECYLKAGPYEHYKACQPLAREVIRRLNCYRRSCDNGVFSQPYHYKEYSWVQPGQEVDTTYQQHAHRRDQQIAAELEKKTAHHH